MIRMNKTNATVCWLFTLVSLISCGDAKHAADSRPVEEGAPVLVLDGLPSVEGLAVSPHGAPYVAVVGSEGQIIHVLGRNNSKLLAKTGGRPTGLAYDQSGDLYVADPQRQAVLKITPWGQVDVLTDQVKSPRGVAVGPRSNIYVTVPDSSLVYRVAPQGKASVLTSEVSSPQGIVASADGRVVFVSDGDRNIWRLKTDGTGRTRFASITDEGQAAGMALDEEGNLYVARDGGGKVSVLSPDGKLVDTYALPAPRVTGVAFGGLDLTTLFVSEASTGSLYKIRAPHRSQRLVWEPDQPLRIVEPVDGDILNRHDGETTAKGLRIVVKGLSRAQGPVRLNGANVPVRDGQFQASVVLGDRENKIEVEAEGGLRQAITVFWDRDSFPRYRVSTDDNIWFLRDIARHADTYKSIFENPYLRFWRDMHRKYGAKIHHNIYYETEGFNLSEMPDKFRGEWQRNADWMHLTFHARANNPDRPYIHASAEEMREDYRLVTREIERFAGREVLSSVTTVHWGETTLAAARALRGEGMRTLVGYFRANEEFPSVCYYVPLAQWRHLMGRDYWKDTKEDLVFVRHDIVINTIKLDEIVPYLEKVAADPHQAEVMELMIHEQYFYPDYRAYEPDYRERVERAIGFVTQRGYKPVFFAEGFLGAVQTD